MVLWVNILWVYDWYEKGIFNKEKCLVGIFLGMEGLVGQRDGDERQAKNDKDLWTLRYVVMVCWTYVSATSECVCVCVCVLGW